MTAPDIDAGAVDPDRRRDGRGRLSSIDTLPEEADEDIAWANAELRERKMPQNEILREFNARLADKGIKGVTKSAFSRHSVRLAIEARRIEASRQIANTVLARLPTNDRSDSMIAAAELVKFRLLELVMDDKADLAEVTLALQRISAIGAREAEVQRRQRKDQIEQADRDAQADREERERENAAAAEEAAKIAGEAGLSADRIAAIRKGVLGLAG